MISATSSNLVINNQYWKSCISSGSYSLLLLLQIVTFLIFNKKQFIFATYNSSSYLLLLFWPIIIQCAEKANVQKNIYYNIVEQTVMTKMFLTFGRGQATSEYTRSPNASCFDVHMQGINYVYGFLDCLGARAISIAPHDS